MELTKEEIQAQIDILNKALEYDWDIYQVEEKLLALEQQLNSAKSIIDLQKDAFEAGRIKYPDSIRYKYYTFEDYLKSKEDGITNSE